MGMLSDVRFMKYNDNTKHKSSEVDDHDIVLASEYSFQHSNNTCARIKIN